MRLMPEPRDEAIPAAPDVFDRKALLARMAVGVGAGLIGLFLWMSISVLFGSGPESKAPEVILRRDPVQALAGEVGESPP
jgi:hypothetical protein